MPQIIAWTIFLFLLGGYNISASPQDLQGDPKNGNRIYEQHCIRCHGPKGDGNGEEGQYLVVKPANFHSVQSSTKTNADLFITIKYGVVFSPMHGWGDRLKDQEIMDVIGYIRFLAPFRALTSHQKTPH